MTLDWIMQELSQWAAGVSPWVRMSILIGLLVVLSTSTIYGTHFLLSAVERLVTNLRRDYSTGKQESVSDGGGDMPAKSKQQLKAMHAAAKGKSTLGIPKKVGKKFAKATKSAKGLPKRVRKKK